MSDFVAAKTFTFAPRKNIYFSVQQKNYVFAPRKKKFAAPPQKFCFAPQNLRAKTRKICGGTQNFVLRRKICAQKRAKPRKRVCVSRRKKCGIARKKNFAPQTAQFARKQKFQKMETLPLGFPRIPDFWWRTDTTKWRYPSAIMRIYA